MKTDGNWLRGPAKGRDALTRNLGVALIVVALLGLHGDYAFAVSFNRVVSLGDSLLDEGGGTSRSPLVSQRLAQRLGVSHTQLAASGATTGSLIAGGQHTEAAANFGPGDLAVLWIGGNDFINNGLSIRDGDDSFLEASAANLDVILETLVDAGMDVLVLNLPDMAMLPGATACGPIPSPWLPCFTEETLPLATAASGRWRDHVNALAAVYGVAVADVYGFSLALQEDPAAFSFLGNLPVIEGAYCELCIFADLIHPSRLGQAYASNVAITALNGFFDPDGLAPLELLSEQEISATVFGPRCGDGVVDAGEDCDDANYRDGDCCSATCTAEPVGTACGDTLCDPNAACGEVGTCEPGEDPIDCDDGLACTIDICSAGQCYNSWRPPILEVIDACEEGWARSLLVVKETSPGNESFLLRLRDGGALDQVNFGVPDLEGGPGYELCVYANDLRLVGGFYVDRAGELCGDEECWRAKGARGWRYKDPEASSDGTRIIDLKGGREGQSQIVWSARNDARRGADSMPTGMAAALEDATSVTVELVPSDFSRPLQSGASRCFAKRFTNIERQESDWFKAR